LTLAFHFRLDESVASDGQVATCILAMASLTGPKIELAKLAALVGYPVEDIGAALKLRWLSFDKNNWWFQHGYG